jgi:hypothetical protein
MSASELCFSSTEIGTTPRTSLTESHHLHDDEQKALLLEAFTR